MSDEDTTPPRRVGSYQLLRCLGRGGFASVYAARDVGSGEPVAVKVLSAADPETSRRFEGEVSRLRRLAHPGLPRLIDAGREGAELYLAMELVDGRPLNVAAAARRFTVNAVVTLLDALAATLTHVHAVGIVHRDIKPQNILMRADGTPVLVDFGLGLTDEATRVTRAGSIVGTFKYMSPELLRVDALVDGRSDLFQLALVARELLEGAFVPPELEALFVATLSVNPDLRPANAAAFRAELRRVRAAERRSGLRESMIGGARTVRFAVPVLTMLVTGALVLWLARGPRAAPRAWTELSASSAAPSPRPVNINELVDHLGPGRVKLDLVRVPAGCVRVGTPAGVEPQRFLAETPAHRACVPAFYLGRHEITQSQYRAVMGLNPSFEKGSQLPVSMVSHEDADVFLGRLRRLTGRGYRLPSEAEWEYACRAGSASLYPWGDDPEASPRHAWTSRNTDGCREVGRLAPNAFGLFDMLGNVSEWVADTAHDDFSNAPTDGRAWINPRNTIFLAKGGGADMEPGYCRPGMRYSPYLLVHFVGLRLALDP